MSRPDLLYRYRALNHFTLDWLESGGLYFASAAELNDAFEVRLNCEFEGVPQEALAHFDTFVSYEADRRFAHVSRRRGDSGLGYLISLGDQVERFGNVNATRAALRALRADDRNGASAIIREFWENKTQWAKREFGICCFSADGLNPLMWGLYGDSNRGICVIVSSRQRPVTDWHRFSYWPVSYSAERSINVLDLGYANALKHLLLTKADGWSFEKEWRLVSTHGRGVQHSSNRNIEGLIVGTRIAENDLALRKRLHSVIENFTVRKPDPWSRAQPRSKHLSVYRAAEDPRRFAFVREPVRDIRKVLAP